MKKIIKWLKNRKLFKESNTIINKPKIFNNAFKMSYSDIYDFSNKPVLDHISDVIVNLALSGASRDEIYEAVRYSADIIDAKKSHDILKISTLYNEFKFKFDKENKND